MPPVRVGIIGVSFMGSTHFNIYKSNPKARVVAISDVNPRRLAGDWGDIGGNIGAGGERVNLKGISTYRRGEDLIADPQVELIDITLPTHLHARYALAALASGKHVLCEKPLATSLVQCDRVLAAAKKARGKFMVAMCMRFWPEWVWLKEKVVDGHRYGKVLSVTLQRHSLTPTWAWRKWLTRPSQSGSAAFDLHIHDSDFVQYLFGRVRRVTSRGVRGKVTAGGWDHLDSFYDVAGCPHVRAEGGFAFEPGWGFWWEFKVQCEKATVFHTLRPAPEFKVFHKSGRIEEIKLKPKKNCETGWSAEIDYFLDCILKKRRVTRVTPKAARNAVAIVQAEVASAASGGKPVKPKLL